MTLRSRITTIIAMLSIAAVLAACGGAATPVPQEDAEAATCAAVQTFSDELRALYSLDPATTSAEDFKAQRLVVEQAWDDVQASLPGLEAADSAAVEAGKAAVETALKNIPTDVPVADAIAATRASADALKGAYLEMADGLGCAIATPF